MNRNGDRRRESRREEGKKTGGEWEGSKRGRKRTEEVRDPKGLIQFLDFTLNDLTLSTVTLPPRGSEVPS